MSVCVAGCPPLCSGELTCASGSFPFRIPIDGSGTKLKFLGPLVFSIIVRYIRRMKRTEIKKEIFKIATAVFRDTQVLFAYLYGSYAVDQASPFSDLDIGIYTPMLSLREQLDLEMALALEIDKMLAQGPVSDVRIMNSLPLAVAGKIITEGILIYCHDDRARVDYETVLRSAYFDFLPFIHNYHRTYLEQIAL